MALSGHHMRDTVVLVPGLGFGGAELVVLGKLFCRRCGYCQPCPQGVAVTMAMTFEGATRRMPRERLVEGWALSTAKVPDQCIECGECEEKCPYDLPIIETIHRNAELAQAMLDMV